MGTVRRGREESSVRRGREESSVRRGREESSVRMIGDGQGEMGTRSVRKGKGDGDRLKREGDRESKSLEKGVGVK